MTKKAWLLSLAAGAMAGWLLTASVSAPAQGAGNEALVRKLEETNRHLARIASALEIIAGTGSRSWKVPK